MNKRVCNGLIKINGIDELIDFILLFIFFFQANQGNP